MIYGMSKTIPETDWIWHGTPGHFICWYACCFRLHTTVGEYRVSSIGCYHPSDDPNRTGKPSEIGLGRLYETMVFRNNSEGEALDYSEIDWAGYNDEAAAREGHRAICRKYATSRWQDPGVKGDPGA